MHRFVLIAFVSAAGLGLVGPGPAQAKSEPWLHLEILEDGGDDAEVRINVPLSMFRVVLDLAGEKVVAEGNVRVNDVEFTVEDLRRVWAELRDAGDAEFLNLREDEDTVRLRREGNFVYLDVREEDDGAVVQARLPVAVVDALLAGGEDELDFEAAVAELRKMDGGEILTARDDGDLVRVWID